MEVKSSDLSSGWSGEAWRASWAFVVENRLPAFVVAVLVPAIVASIQFNWRSLEMKTALITAVWTLVVYFGVCLAVYLVFLLYRVPKRRLVAAGELIRQAEDKVAEFSERLRPKIRMECNPNFLGCSQPSPHVQWFRVAVNCDGINSVEGCRGYISNIRKDGASRWTGDNVTVTFAPGDELDATNKTIHAGKPEFLDIFGVTYDSNALFVGTKERNWQFAPELKRIFAETGDYFLTVIISGKLVPPIQAELKFTWTRNWATSILSMAT